MYIGVINEAATNVSLNTDSCVQTMQAFLYICPSNSVYTQGEVYFDSVMAIQWQILVGVGDIFNSSAITWHYINTPSTADLQIDGSEESQPVLQSSTELVASYTFARDIDKVELIREGKITGLMPRTHVW